MQNIVRIWYGCQPRINNLGQRPDLGGVLVTHVVCTMGKCGNAESRNEVALKLYQVQDKVDVLL